MSRLMQPSSIELRTVQSLGCPYLPTLIRITQIGKVKTAANDLSIRVRDNNIPCRGELEGLVVTPVPGIEKLPMFSFLKGRSNR